MATFREQYVATAGYDNRVILWEAASHRAIARGWHDHLANQCRFSGSGRYLVSTSSDYSARLWAVPTMQLCAVCQAHEDDVEMAAINPQETLIATASRDHQIRLFDFSGHCVRILSGHEADVISVEWSDNGQEIISSSDDGTIRRWCPQTGQQRACIDLADVETDTVVMTPTGVMYAGNDAGEIVIIRDTHTQTVSAHKAGIKRLVYDAHAGVLVSLSYDRSVHMYRCTPDGSIALWCADELPAMVWPRSCAVLGQHTLVFATFGTSYATYDMVSQTWNLEGIQETNGCNAVLSYHGSLYTVGDAGVVRQNGGIIARLGSLCNFLLPFHHVVLTGGQTGQVMNALTGEVLYQHRSPLNCGAVCSNGTTEFAVIGTYTGEGLVFHHDVHGHVQLAHIVPLHQNAIKGIACHEQQMFSVCATGAAAWHRTDTFDRIAYCEAAHDKISNGCDTTPDGVFVSVSRDRKMRLWGDTTPMVIETPHVHSIKCVRVSVDGRYVATGAYDGTVHVYDLATQCWIRGLRPTVCGISSLSAVPEAGKFVASAYDGQVYDV